MPFFERIKVLKPLNLLNYNLGVAQEELTKKLVGLPMGKNMVNLVSQSYSRIIFCRIDMV